MQKLKNNLSFIGELTIRKYINGKLISTQKETNKVVSSSGYGRNLVIRQLANDQTYGIAIDSAKIGDDDTAPANSDTDLGNAIVSGILVANQVVSNDSATFQFFISAGTLPDGVYEEFGMFIGGRLFSRAIFASPYSKSAGEDTRIDYAISITG